MKQAVLILLVIVTLSCPSFGQQKSVNIPFDMHEIISQAYQQTRNGEFLVDPSPVYNIPPESQGNVSVAFDGTNYFLVWEDGRNDDWYYDIFGIRVNHNGEVLDPGGIIISDAPGDQYDPAVAFDGTNFLVVWTDDRDIPVDSDENIYGARVSQNGEVLDPDGIQICIESDYQEYPDLAFDGTNYLVVWREDRFSEYKAYGSFVTPDGSVLNPGGFRISTSEGANAYPRVAASGSNYFVAWSDYRNSLREIYGTRLSFTGEILDPDGIRITNDSEDQTYPDVASDGTDFFIIWIDERNAANSNIYGARVTHEGTLLDPAGIPLVVINDYAYNPRINYGNGYYMLSWDLYVFDAEDVRKVYGTFIDQNGVMPYPDGFMLSNESENSYMAETVYNGTDFYFVYECDGRILSNWVDMSGNLINTEGTDVTAGMNSQQFPAIASDGSGYLAVWVDNRLEEGHNIFGIRLDENGIPLDPQSFLISNAAEGGELPDVEFNGTSYLVVWDIYNSILGVRVSTGGVVLDPVPLVISSGSWSRFEPKVASFNQNWIVVWTDERNNNGKWGNSDIYGCRISANGEIIDPDGIQITSIAENQYSPDIAFDGNNLMVTWADERGGFFAEADIYAARFSTDGSVLDPTGIGIALHEDILYQYPSIAFDGYNYLIVYQSIDYETFKIQGKRIEQNGTVIDTEPVELSYASADELFPRVTFDGDSYLVAWQDQVSNYYFDIFGVRLNPSGQILESMVLVDQPMNQYSPALTHGNGHDLLLCYSGFTEYIGEQPAMVKRIWGKIFDFNGTGEIDQSWQNNMHICPNPSTGNVQIFYDLKGECKAELSVYNIHGQKLFTLVDKKQASGEHIIQMDGRSLQGGIYIIKLQVGSALVAARLVITH